MRAVLKQWGMAFLEWLFTGVAFGLGVLLVAALFLSICATFAGAAQAETVNIPRAAYQHRDTLIRASRVVWGLEAPVSVFAAQIHTESWWKNDTVSSAGAQGLAQFMPSTAKWLPTVAPEVGKTAPFNPGWALRALVSYDKWLWDRLHGADACQRMAFTLSAYNGGIGWVGRDRKEAERQGRDPARWFGQVEEVNAGRSASSLRENRRYVRLILLERQYWYRKAGWGPGVGCGGGHD